VRATTQWRAESDETPSGLTPDPAADWASNSYQDCEAVTEFAYQPHKCGRNYRLAVVRKNISVQKGELVLFKDIQYFFYITNHTDYRAEQIVALANERCEQENVIEQLKNGVNAMSIPVDDLMSNWAYRSYKKASSLRRNSMSSSRRPSSRAL
jgi:hypothetical protein